MPAERDLDVLLSALSPEIRPGTYVFCSVDSVPADARITMGFEEAEGTTLVLSIEEAERQGLAYEFSCEWIVIGARSDLATVGLLAAITGALAAEGISTNVVSAYHHDHLFVPAGRAGDALEVLARLADP